MSLFDPDLWNVISAVVGALLGYWLRHSQSALPSELAQALAALLDKQKQKQNEGLLGELLDLAKKEAAPK